MTILWFYSFVPYFCVNFMLLCGTMNFSMNRLAKVINLKFNDFFFVLAVSIIVL